MANTTKYRLFSGDMGYNIKEKLEKIFYDAGGKPENLKKAILNRGLNAEGNWVGFDKAAQIHKIKK